MSTDRNLDIKIVEVGPRDGLQNEPTRVSVDQRVNLIDRLSAAGLSEIEVGSFVSPQWVPQMAATDQVLARIQRHPGVRYPVLIPNLQGLTRALAHAQSAPLTSIAVFTGASETFCQKNINCSSAESLRRFADILAEAAQHQLPVRGYLSCVIGCPYEGRIPAPKVAQMAKALLAMGCYEVSLGDTIGVATPKDIKDLLHCLASEGLTHQLALHCHDTYGQALANIYAALDMGITTFDSAVAGLGGCPYARGASGNVATEDLLYLLHGCGLTTGVDLAQVITAGRYICQALKRPNQSRVANAQEPSP